MKRSLNFWYRLAPLLEALTCTLFHHFWLTPPAAQIRSLYGTKLDGKRLKDIWDRMTFCGRETTNPICKIRIANKQEKEKTTDYIDGSTTNFQSFQELDRITIRLALLRQGIVSTFPAHKVL